jgi:N,N-dimethylformamidase
MLDAIRDYVGGGGRLAYLGGNGFCHRVAFDPDSLATVEVRRWGGADWQAAPGEHFLSVSGELGGMWRSLGRPPHELAGCGYIAEGFDSCSHYRRSADSFDSRAEWVFEGIGPDELIGDFGLVGEGAAGLELDAYDPSLGSPAEALVLASSEDHTLTYMLTDGTLPNPASSGAESPRVRADIVYYVTPANGAVFSVGSIAWCGSLWSNRGQNNVARITENVLRRFSGDGPLPW